MFKVVTVHCNSLMTTLDIFIIITKPDAIHLSYSYQLPVCVYVPSYDEQEINYTHEVPSPCLDGSKLALN